MENIACFIVCMCGLFPRRPMRVLVNHSISQLVYISVAKAQEQCF